VVPHATVLPPTAVLPPGASSHGLSNKRPFSQLSGQTEAPLLPDCACNGAAAATVHTAPVAAIYTVPHTAMPPPASTISTAVPSKSASKSKLRTKRPQGATDLKLVSASNGDGAGTSGAPSMPLYSAAAPPNSATNFGFLSASSLLGSLETPRELKEFASQLSPHLGLTSSAMLDFLATDDVIAQIANGVGFAGGLPSPLLSARAALSSSSLATSSYLAPSAPPLAVAPPDTAPTE